MRALTKHCTARARETRRDFRREFEVRNAADSCACKQAPLPGFTPDERMRQRRTIFDDFLRPYFYVGTYCCEIADFGTIGNDTAFANICSFTDAHTTRADRFT